MAQLHYSDAEILAYLDEQLPIERMAAIEEGLRQSADLRHRAAALLRVRDTGEHSVGEIWRRGRLSCAPREELEQYLDGTLEAGKADYLRFHLETIGCRFCSANLEDLRRLALPAEEPARRRKKFFDSSAGYMRSERDPE